MRHQSLIHQLGFTMIELLVVITIIMLLTGGGIAAYITFNDRQNLQNSAKLVQSYIRSAQTKARAGEKPVGCDRLNGYRIVLTAASSNVVLSAVCANGNYVRSTYTLPGNVTSESTQTMNFANLYGGVGGAGTIVLRTNNTTLYRYSFKVTDGGEVSAGGFL